MGVRWDSGYIQLSPEYTPYRLGIFWVYPLLKGSNRWIKQLGYHQKGITIFPMKGGLLWQVVGHSINTKNLFVLYFEIQRSNRRPFPIKTRVIWVPGILKLKKIYRNWGDCFLETWIWREGEKKHHVNFLKSQKESRGGPDLQNHWTSGKEIQMIQYLETQDLHFFNEVSWFP